MDTKKRIKKETMTKEQIVRRVQAIKNTAGRYLRQYASPRSTYQMEMAIVWTERACDRLIATLKVRVEELEKREGMCANPKSKGGGK
ncbi:MAG: hypothetical protein WC455_12485 [Dehalococcoidia bacterium]|jgi:hypothetical protein